MEGSSIFKNTNIWHSDSPELWTYIIDKSYSIPENYYITLSYLDIILNGCMEINNQFVSEFIKETDSWEVPILNDRDNPRYERHMF